MSQRLFLVGGTNDGKIEIMHVGTESIDLASSLHHGHSETIRALHWNCDVGRESGFYGRSMW